MPENPRPTLIATDAPAADAREAAARKRATALNAGHRLSRLQRRRRAIAICPIRFDNRQGDEMIMPQHPQLLLRLFLIKKLMISRPKNDLHGPLAIAPAKHHSWL